MYSILSNNGRSATVQTYLLDLESDLQNIPIKNCSPGDKCFVIENSKWFMMNHNKQWVQVNMNSGGNNDGSDNDNWEEIIYNGGLV